VLYQEVTDLQNSNKSRPILYVCCWESAAGSGAAFCWQRRNYKKYLYIFLYQLS